MEEEDDFGEGHKKQYHRQEAISAVAEEEFMGYEDDEYDDLYNDVNVGEGFHQTLQRSDLGFKTEEEDKKKTSEPEPRKEEDEEMPPPGLGLVQMGTGVVSSEEGKNEFHAPSAASRPVENYGPSSLRSEKSESQFGSLGFRGAGEAPSRGSGVAGPIDGFTPPVSGGRYTGNPEQVNNRVDTSVRHGSVAGSIGGGGGGALNGDGGSIGVSMAGGTGGGSTGVSAYSGTVLFVGDLLWWTTDVDLESEMSKYGQVKEVKFFEEKASGKSKGYAQVEFYDPAAMIACQEGMNGHVFNGRPCVVAVTPPNNVRRMGDSHMNKNQGTQSLQQSQGRRGAGDSGGRGGAGPLGNSNYQGGDGGRNFGRPGWGRGGQGMMGRGQSGPMKNRVGPVGAGGRGMMSNGGTGNNSGGGIFGQGLAPQPMMHPQAMIGQGFDPTYGGPMGRVGGYGGYPTVLPPYGGVLPPFPPVGTMPLPGVAPHVNPAFFGRGMPAGAMGMMPTGGADGSSGGMWPDPNMPAWAGDEYGGRTGETSYGEDAASDHGYGDNSSHERTARSSGAREKERSSERGHPGDSDRRYREDRDTGRHREKEAQEWSERRHHDDRDRERDRERDKEREHDRDRYRDDREKYADHHRHREREWENKDEWDRGRSSRSHSRSRVLQEEESRPRSRDADYGRRRRD